MIQGLLQFFVTEKILESSDCSKYMSSIASLIPGEKVSIHIPLLDLKDLGAFHFQKEKTVKEDFHLGFHLEVFDEHHFKLSYLEYSLDACMLDEHNICDIQARLSHFQGAASIGDKLCFERKLEIEYSYSHPYWSLEKNEVQGNLMLQEEKHQLWCREAETIDLDIHSQMTLKNLVLKSDFGWRSAAGKVEIPLGAFLSPDIFYFIHYYLQLDTDFYESDFQFWQPGLYFQLIKIFRNHPSHFISVTHFLRKTDPFSVSYLSEIIERYQLQMAHHTNNLKLRAAIDMLVSLTSSPGDEQAIHVHQNFHAHLPDSLLRARKTPGVIEIFGDEEYLDYEVREDNPVAILDEEGDEYLEYDAIMDEVIDDLCNENYVFIEPEPDFNMYYDEVINSQHFFFKNTSNYHFFHLKTYKDFVNEARLMEHCILSHWINAVKYDHSYVHIKPIHRPDKKGYTAEIIFNQNAHTYTLTQLVGPYNQMPPKKLIEEVEKQIEARNDLRR